MVSGRTLVAPGAYDGLSARVIERAGFEVVHATGAGISCARGYPDLGLLSMAEVVDSVRIISQATSLPVIADADAGYGSVQNVVRTVKEFERAGAAGIHIEDQVTPKKCGLLPGKHLISVGEMVAKIRAALDSRQDSDFVIVARTDARSVFGLECQVWTRYLHFETPPES